MLRRIVAMALALASLALGLTVVAATPAGAGPDDDFSLAKTDDVGGEALIGEEITYTLTATGDHVSGDYLYNLSFRDVLPVGVSFVSGDPAPTAVLDDVPAAGQTTVIWENVNDLPAGSNASISYTVDTNPDFAGGTTGSTTVPVGATVTNSAQAVASLDAFLIPDWSPVTGAFTGDYDGTASATHVLDIIPFRVDKVGPGELLRGVHTNGFGTGGGTSGDTWTIEIENNPDYAMTGVTLQDVLGPQLEFLGCAGYYPLGDDNSTDVPFRETTAAADEEWAGSGPMATDPVSASCLTPTAVTTVAAGGGLANTVVDWTIGALAPGATVLVTYRAGIPMRANTTTWASAGAPTAASLDQGRNLDNNSGPSTNELDATIAADPELLTDGAPALTNTATAIGTYAPTGTSQTDDDVELTESEDIVITKAMTGSLVHGSTVTTDLVISTSEYRDFTDLVVRDLLPSALCYTGTYGTNETSGSGWHTTDCPGAGAGTGTATSARELATGGPYGTGRLEVVWDQTAVPALAAVAADDTVTIPYSAVVRTTYRGGLAQLAGEPVLAGDEVTNHAEVSGPDFVAAAHTNDGGADDEPDATIDGDTTSASLSNTLPSIDKRVGAKAGPLANGGAVTGATCAASYGSITWQDTMATGFGPGDVMCFELGATFPSQVDYENVVIEDLLPPGYTYVAGSAARIVSIDDLAGTTFDSATMRWNLGTVDNSGRDFRWVIAVTVTDPADGAAGDIYANLQKMIHNQSGGVVFQYRDEVPVEWTEPQVDIVKGVKSVDAVDNSLDVGPYGPDHDGSATGGSTSVEVQADAAVTYRLDVANDGNAAALDVEVWDRIPSGLSCAMVSAISAGGACASGVISWTVPSIAASGTTELTYVLTMPSTVPAHESWTNTAGVRTYQGATDSGLFDYYPTSNIDPTVSGLENTDRADDQAFVATAAPTVAKAQASGIAESGNTSNGVPAAALDRATIGEVVRYDLTVTIPDGTRVVDGVITDVLTTGLTYFEGNAAIAGANVVVAPSVTSTAVDPEGDRLDGGVLSTPAVGSGGTVTYTLPADYRNAPNGVDDTVVVTFYVQAATGSAGTTRNNSATFDYEDGSGAAQPTRTTNTTQLRLVEPSPDVVKVHTVPAAGAAAPGDTVTYQVTVSNLSGTNVSVLHEVVLVDLVPVGTTPVRSGGGLVSADGDLVAATGVSPAGSFTGTWSETNRTITWTSADWAPLQSINPGVTRTYTYQAVVDDPATASGTLVNTVDLDGANLASADPNLADGRTYSDSDPDSITLPAVTFVKDIEPLPSDASDRTEVTVGEPLDYDIAVTLPADTQAYDLTVFDDLPAGIELDTFDGATISGPCVALPGSSAVAPGDIEEFAAPVGGNSARIAWFLGDVLADGATCTITLAYTVHVNNTAGAPDDLVNSANVRWNGTDEIASASPASLPGSHDAPADAAWDNRPAADTETIRVVEPQLAIDKDVTTTTGGAVGTCNRTAGNNTTGSNDLDTQSGLTNGCDVDAGDELRYTITLTNSGTTDAYDTIVTDVLPDGYEPLVAPGGAVAGNGATITGANGSTGTWNATTRTITWTLPMAITDGGSLTVGLDVVLVASADLDDAQDLTNVADITEYFALTAATRSSITTGDVPTYGNGPGATRGGLLDDEATVEVHFPELAITKSAVDDATDARFDEPFTWQVVVENVAPVAAAFDIDVADTLPAGWAYVTNSARITTPSGGPTAVEPTIVGQDLTWVGVRAGTGQPLAPGQQVLITFDAVPLSADLAPDAATGIANTGPANPHTNSATTSGEDAAGATGCCDTGAGPRPYTDTDTADAVIRRADLSVTKAVLDAAPIRYGDLVTYTVTVDNAGPSPATGVTLVDLFPADLTYVSTTSVDAGSFVGGTGTWNVGTVPVGATYELRVVVEVDAVGSITNIAAVETSNQWDPDSTPGNGDDTEDDQDEVTIDALDSGLGNRVWLDLDADGVQDPGEPGIPDVTVAVSWTDASLIDQVRTVVTHADGNWNMLGLPVDTPLTVTVDPSSTTVPAGTGGAGGTLPGGVTPTWELADDPDITIGQAANGHTSGLDHETVGVVLTPGQTSYVDVDFGYVGVNSLGDAVWFDIDGDGAAAPEAGDRALGGVDLEIVWFGFDDTEGTADDLTFADTTDAAGAWSVPALPDGRYRVRVDAGTLPTGVVPTHDLDGVGTANNSGIVSLGVAQPAPVDRLDVDFAYTGPGSLGDTVWLDIDRDGLLDGAEVPLAGIRVTATYTLPAGAVTLETTTAVDGTYLFEHLPLGVVITVTVDDTTLPAGLVPTHDLDGGDDHTAAVTLTTPSPARLDADFGYAGQGRIGDLVWFDLDGNGTATPDADEPGLAGVTVTLTWTNPTGGADMVLVTTTDADGGYLFDHLPAGDYDIALSDVPAGMVASYDVDGGADSGSSVTLAAAGVDLDQDFSFVGTGEVGDLVWHDRDADGTVDPGEPPIAGVTIAVTWTDSSSGTTHTWIVVTDADGLWGVDRVPAGAIGAAVVTASVPAGFAPTFDLDGGLDHEAALTLGAGGTRLDVDFGYREEVDLAVDKHHEGDFVVGDENRWTIDVTNAGPSSAAAPVTVSDDLPAGIDFVRAEGPWDCTDTDGRVRCVLTDDSGVPTSLEADADARLVLVVDVAAEAAPGVVNTATVSTPTPDTDPTDDTDDDPTDVPLAVLSITKSLDGELRAGAEAVYLLAVVNDGPSATSGTIEVVDELPAGLTHVATDAPDGVNCRVDDDVVRCRTDEVLDVGDDITIGVTVRVSAVSGADVTNVATVRGGNEVNGAPIDPDVLGAAGARPSDEVEATVLSPNSLALTGAQVALLLAGASLLIGIGATTLLVRRRLT